jgi:hypothetical protein
MVPTPAMMKPATRGSRLFGHCSVMMLMTLLVMVTVSVGAANFVQDKSPAQMIPA